MMSMQALFYGRNRRQYRKFSLIELLVVIAIISMLASMLMPALSTSRKKGKYSRWTGFKTDLKANSDLVLFHTFEELGESTLPNLAMGNPLAIYEKVDTYSTVVNGASWIQSGGRWPGKPTISFDGINDDLRTSYEGIDGAGDRTVSAWVKLTSPGAMSIVSWGGGGGQSFTFLILNLFGTGMKLCVYNLFGLVVGNTSIDDGNWHHIAIAFENDGTPNIQDFKFYVDGKLDADGGGTPAPSFTMSVPLDTRTNIGSSMYIGAFTDGVSFPFNGEMDEIAIFKAALSASEIENIFRMGQP